MSEWSFTLEKMDTISKMLFYLILQLDNNKILHRLQTLHYKNK